jgi:hypothetical protein
LRQKFGGFGKREDAFGMLMTFRSHRAWCLAQRTLTCNRRGMHIRRVKSVERPLQSDSVEFNPHIDKVVDHRYPTASFRVGKKDTSSPFDFRDPSENQRHESES